MHCCSFYKCITNAALVMQRCTKSAVPLHYYWALKCRVFLAHHGNTCIRRMLIPNLLAPKDMITPQKDLKTATLGLSWENNWAEWKQGRKCNYLKTSLKRIGAHFHICIVQYITLYSCVMAGLGWNGKTIEISGFNFNLDASENCISKINVNFNDL